MECFSLNLRGRFQSNAAELEVYDPATDPNSDGLGAVTGSKFLHDVLHVPFHRLFGDEELFRDIALAVPAGHLLQHVYFAPGQKLLTKMFRQVSRNLRRDGLRSGVHFTDHLYESLPGHALPHVTLCSGPTR